MNTYTGTRRLVLMAVMAAMLALMAPISVPIGPVPFTLGLFAVVFWATLMPTLSALGGLAVYVLLGVVGLPVFSHYRGGPQILWGPTGGYILGYFIIVAVIAGVFNRTKSIVLRGAGVVAAMLLFYLAGTLWYSWVTGTELWAAALVCVVPFVATDIIKIALALVLGHWIKQRMETAK